MTTILVLEDDDLFRSYLTTLLERAGYKVRSLPNGRGAVKLITNHRIHLVLTDLYMPDTDGLETVRRVKKHWPELPVIGITSGEPDDPCLRAMLVMGAEQVLTKPLDEAALLRAIHKAVAPRKQANGRSNGRS